MRIGVMARRLFSNLFRRYRTEVALDDELRAWVNELTDRHAAKGLPRAEARRQALLETGGIELIKENVREVWLGQNIETALQDIRYAFRALCRAPGFTSVVILTLATGIGASLTMFSLMRGVLWRPLPYPEPDRIVTIQVDARNVPGAGATQAGIPRYQELQPLVRTGCDHRFAGREPRIRGPNGTRSCGKHLR